MTTTPQWQTDRLAVLLDALNGVPVSDTERASLTCTTEPGVVHFS
ncbi:MAG: hypothetical protein ACRDTT_06010 [Pseudonocardiaceae bacterium]